jgi:hypothetical protein
MPRLMLFVGLLFAGTLALAFDPPRQEKKIGGIRKAIPPKMSELDNGNIKLGVDLALGGAITYLSPSNQDRNVVNSWDFGRQIQMSFYGGPVPFTHGDKRPAKHWEHLGWNPVQSGDDYGNPSKILEHANDGKTIHVKCIPMQWPLDNVPGECVYECWIRLDGNAAFVRCRVTNQRSDKTQHAARTQELPAVYTNGPYHRLMTYTGAKPFTGDAITQITRPRKHVGPWMSWTATERWAALVDDRNWGLGVWMPACTKFSGGFAGKPGQGGPKDNPTGYIAPNRQEILDHDIVFEFEYVLILDQLDAIRQFVAKRSAQPAPPTFTFATDRQGWHHVNAGDAGWKLDGLWVVKLEKDDPQLISPPGFWPAEAAKILLIEAAFQTTQRTGQVFWSTLEADFHEKASVTFPVQGDGEFRTYAIDLSANPLYRGGVTQLRLDPIPRGAKGDWVKIRSIRLRNP